MESEKTLAELSGLAQLGRLVVEKARAGEGPALVVAEAVTGLISGKGISEFFKLAAQLVTAKYRYAVLEI